MNDDDVRQPLPASPSKGFARTLAGAVALFGLGVALGYAPLWMTNRDLTRELSVAQVSAEAHTDSMRVARLYVLVSAALVESERGELERARSLMSRFYDGLDREWQGIDAARIPPAVVELRRTRDETITRLSRAEPAAVASVRGAHAAFLAVADPSAADVGQALALPALRMDSVVTGR